MLYASFPGVLLLGIDFKGLSNSFSSSSISQKSFYLLVRQSRSIEFRMLDRFVNNLSSWHLKDSSKKILISSITLVWSQIYFPFLSSFFTNDLTDHFFEIKKTLSLLFTFFVLLKFCLKFTSEFKLDSSYFSLSSNSHWLLLSLCEMFLE